MTLEADREHMRTALLDFNDRIQSDLDYFQRGKIADIRVSLKGLASGFISFHQKMAIVWKNTKVELDQTRLIK